MSIVFFKLLYSFSTKRRFTQLTVYHTQHIAQIASYYYFPLENNAFLVYNIYITQGCFAGLEITMSEMNEYTPELIELVDDEGNKKNFELIDAAEIDDEVYYAMLPEYDENDLLSADLELVILKTIEEDGEEILASIEDEAEYLKVSEVFLRRMEETLGEDEDGEDE